MTSLVKIVIDNSYCKIESCPEDILEVLRGHLSYELKKNTYLKIKAKRMWMDTKKYLINKKTKKFPTGILNLVLKHLLEFKDRIKLELDDLRRKPEQYLFLTMNKSLPPLRYYQNDVVNLLPLHHRGTFDLATGTGKTRQAAEIIANKGVNTLVIVPTRLLVKQTIKNFQLFFGKKYVGNHKDPKTKPITVMTAASLPNKDPEFFKMFDMLIVDEAHHAAAKTYTEANKTCWNHIYYRYHVSGTPFRNDGADLELVGLIGETLYSYSAAQAIKDGFLVPPYFFVYEVPNPQDFSVRALEYQDEYRKFIVESNLRNRMIAETTKSLQVAGKQILILVEHKDHGETLKNLIPNSLFIHGTTKGNEKVLEQFELGNVKTVIATSGILGEGIDISNIDILVLAGGMKAESATIQKIGRMLRLRPGKNKAIVIDYWDKNTKTLERHSKARVEVFETYETEVKYFAA